MNASVIKSSGLLSVLLVLCNEWPVRADIERIGLGDYDPPSFCFPNQPITGPQAWEAETYGAASPMLMPRDPSRRASKAPDDSPEIQQVCEEESLAINWDGKELIVRPCERPKSDSLECPGLGKELRRNSEADR
jgi:hypothetical protein